MDRKRIKHQLLKMAEEQRTIEIEEPCNNIVAQSDYDAALAAIESTFDNFQLSHQSHEDENLDHNVDQELIEEVYQAAKRSLLNNVKRVVRPIDDNDFSDFVDQYHYILEEESDNDDIDMSKGQGLTPENEESDEEEEEIDHEELFDMKAWNDAQELRTRIRTMSNTVQSVRERVLKCAEDDILSSISTQLIDKPVKIVFNDDDGNGEENTAGNTLDDKENNAQECSSVCKTSTSGNSNMDSTALQNSLRDLSNTLKDPKWARLPNRIQSFQETIEAIQKETNEDRVMSQTEIAITSQYNKTIDESSRRKLLEEDSEDEELSSKKSTTNAMDRLALFGQMFS